jgi:23S rRNA (cytosine1962-C5)-methyltransferase
MTNADFELRKSAEGASLVLKPREDRRIRAGHLWVFSNEIDRVIGLMENGDLVDVINARGRFCGRAYYNRNTLIAARLLTDSREEIDTAFMTRRIRQAAELRESMLGPVPSCRMVYSEGDLLPGLIVDKYNEYLVVQLLTLGMEKLRRPIIASLMEVFDPGGILLRNDSPYRELETLPLETCIAEGNIPETMVIDEGGVRFEVDLSRGQKTGFYFDQRLSRFLVRRLAEGRRVLDCFCYTGGFSINCALGGARSVLAVDDSAAALENLRRNARLNGVSAVVDTLAGNCFDVLRDLASRKEYFDLIILDPPAFVKSRSRLKTGVAGYREINMTSMKMLSPNGLLLTCSCSQNLSREAFQSLLRIAARDAGRRFRINHFLTQAPDHPILHAMPETQYLKCFVLQAIT